MKGLFSAGHADVRPQAVQLRQRVPQHRHGGHALPLRRPREDRPGVGVHRLLHVEKASRGAAPARRTQRRVAVDYAPRPVAVLVPPRPCDVRAAAGVTAPPGQLRRAREIERRREGVRRHVGGRIRRMQALHVFRQLLARGEHLPRANAVDGVRAVAPGGHDPRALGERLHRGARAVRDVVVDEERRQVRRPRRHRPLRCTHIADARRDARPRRGGGTVGGA
mmetsp:Transcript_7172/g.21671  ORF Transcript_7172/g.21671 Transcript_7172/m.21671 type:complete len:222 (-) Transcript_7172:417-1082(-)